MFKNKEIIGDGPDTVVEDLGSKKSSKKSKK